MRDSFNDEPRQRDWRRLHETGYWREASFDSEPPPSVTRKTPVEPSEEAKPAARVTGKPPIPDYVGEGERLCWLFECGLPLPPGQRKYCNAEHANTYRVREHRRRQAWRRSVLSLSPFEREETAPLVERVVDAPSYRDAIAEILAEEERREAEAPTIEFTLRLVNDYGDTMRWAGTGIESRRDIVEAFCEDQKRGHGQRAKTPRPERLSEDGALLYYDDARDKGELSKPPKGLSKTALE